MSAYASVTPSDTVNLSTPRKRLWVGVAGNVALLSVGDTSPTTFYGVPTGWLELPVDVVRVYATGTTASQILMQAPAT